MIPRRPRVYLVVILPMLIAGALVPLTLVSVYASSHGLSSSEVPTANALLIGIPAFFLWIPLALLLSNAILKSIPKLRLIAETYVAKAARPEYADSQRELLKVLCWVAAPCIPLILLGWFI